MTNMPDYDKSPDDPPEPIKPPRPKRGAFPTPKPEIEKAKQYIPDLGEEEDFPEEEPGHPPDTDGEKES